MISREAAIAVVSLRPDRYTKVSSVYADRIRALPAVQSKVKPLVWCECNVSDEATDRAKSMGQEYSVGYDDNGAWYAHSETLGMDLANAPTRDAAKVAAQAHYDARILSALEPAVQPDAAAIREAALREALETCLTAMERADFADGWCCCGDDMLKHPSPMDCGHTPVDIAEYHASLAIKNARAALNTGKEVMPNEPDGSAEEARNIGPGDQAVAGAARYRTKPVVKEAIQWTGENLAEVLTFTGKHPKWDEWFSSFEHYEAHVRNDRQVFKIKTLEGTMEASPGDWIIRGLRGECYPCKPDIFAATYEPVAEAAPRRASGPIDPGAGFATSGAEARWIADVEAGVYDDAPEEIGILQARVEDQDRRIADLTRQLQGQPRRQSDVNADTW
jgi:hypothetical protein